MIPEPSPTNLTAVTFPLDSSEIVELAKVLPPMSTFCTPPLSLGYNPSTPSFHLLIPVPLIMFTLIVFQF